MATGVGVSWGPLWWGRPFGGNRPQKQRKPLTFLRLLALVFLAPVYMVVFMVWLLWLPVELLVRFFVWMIRKVTS